MGIVLGPTTSLAVEKSFSDSQEVNCRFHARCLNIILLEG
jgi:hypothetical protein